MLKKVSREQRLCDYCLKSATWVKLYADEVEGITYDFLHCEEHKNLNDMSAEALELWRRKHEA